MSKFIGYSLAILVGIGAFFAWLVVKVFPHLGFWPVFVVLLIASWLLSLAKGHKA